MITVRRVLVLALALSGPFAATTRAGAAAAPGWSEGACATADGVTLVVDYQGLGGGTVTRCVTGAADNGFAALQGAGFVVDQPINTPNFVCRINGAPGPGSESCVETPPQTAYWSYWRAKRGGAWVYSDLGAASKGTAKAGSVQGWSFSDGTNPPPRVAPPSATPAVTAAPPTAPPATAPPATAAPAGGGTASAGPGGSTSGGPSATSPVVSAGGSRPAPTTTARVGSAAPTAPGATTTVAPGAPADAGAVSTTAAAPDASVLGTSETAPTTTSESASTTVDDDRTIELAASRGSGDDRGSPIGLIVGVAVVGALGGAAFVLRRRRS